MLDKAIRNLVKRGVLDGKRTFSTDKQYDRFLGPRKRHYGFKPEGLWYAMGSSWIEWCLGEQFNGVGKYVYEVEVNFKSNIIVLDSEEEVFSFTRKHKKNDSLCSTLQCSFIEWQRVIDNFDGIEVNPYFRNLRFDHGLIWYNGWDVPSGCVWKAKAKKRVTLIAEYKDKYKEFVIL